MECQGWTSYQTWSAWHTIVNDETKYKRMIELAKENPGTLKLAVIFEKEFGKADEVNWIEIAIEARAQVTDIENSCLNT